MNDFTKEELEDLEEFLSDAPEFFDDSDGVLFNLHEKVKIMIDNYCKHLNTAQCPISEQLECRDCGEVIR